MEIARSAYPVFLRFAAVAGVMLFAGCGSDSDGNTEPDPEPEPTYAEIVSAGWIALAAGDLDTAIDHFLDAVTADATQAEPHTGLGWCRILLDDPATSDTDFTTGSLLTGTDAVQADLQSGWAFVGNALKDPTGIDTSNFSDSNDRITVALTLDPDWSFPYVAGIDRDDLVLLQAANHFALGDFASSLGSVQVLDPLFTADVGTPGGLAALAIKIEELRDGGGIDR